MSGGWRGIPVSTTAERERLRLLSDPAVNLDAIAEFTVELSQKYRQSIGARPDSTFHIVKTGNLARDGSSWALISDGRVTLPFAHHRFAVDIGGRKVWLLDKSGRISTDIHSEGDASRLSARLPVMQRVAQQQFDQPSQSDGELGADFIR